MSLSKPTYPYWSLNIPSYPQLVTLRPYTPRVNSSSQSCRWSSPSSASDALCRLSIVFCLAGGRGGWCLGFRVSGVGTFKDACTYGCRLFRGFRFKVGNSACATKKPELRNGPGIIPGILASCKTYSSIKICWAV